jgi:hypothetical protein
MRFNEFYKLFITLALILRKNTLQNNLSPQVKLEFERTGDFKYFYRVLFGDCSTKISCTVWVIYYSEMDPPSFFFFPLSFLSLNNE